MTTKLALAGLWCIHLVLSILSLDTAAVSVPASYCSFVAITVQGCTLNTLLITKSKNIWHRSCFTFRRPQQLEFCVDDNANPCE